MPSVPSTYDASIAVGPLDQILLRGAGAGKSPNELSKLVGGTIKPEAAAKRVFDLLASRDWLNQVQRKQLLIDDLMAVKDKLMDQVLKFNMVKDSASPLIKVLGEIGKQLDKDKIDLNAALTQIRQAHADMMLAAIRVALERSFLELEKRHPDVPRSELTEIFQVALPDAVKEIEARVVEPQ
jgi:hypothetical protein